MIIKGTAGNDTLDGTGSDDRFDLIQGGDDNVTGEGGNDVFAFHNAYNTQDVVNGGEGNDAVALSGGAYSDLVLGTLTSVEFLRFGASNSYDVTTTAQSLDEKSTFDVIAAQIAGDNTITFDGMASEGTRFHFVGGTGNSTFTGSDQDDVFDLSRGGTDTAKGGAGHDVFYMGSHFRSLDQINGNGGPDTIVLNGGAIGSVGAESRDGAQAPNALVLGPTTLLNVERLELYGKVGYDIVSNDATVAAHSSLLVDGAHLTAGTSLFFDGSQETDGHFHFIGGPGINSFTGGAQSDTFDMGLFSGATDTARGGGGNDTFIMGNYFNSSDIISGGTGYNTMILTGGYVPDTGPGEIDFSNLTMTGIQKLELDGSGFVYQIRTDDANVAAGQTLLITEGANTRLYFHGGNESDGHFDIVGSALGGDILVGGAQSDTFDLSAYTGGGYDSVTGADGADTIIAGVHAGDVFIYNHVSESTSINFDTIHNVDFSTDVFQTPSDISPSALFVGGMLNQATFDANLTSMTTGKLGANGADLFTPTSGDYAGHTFFVVDMNGQAGYQASQDLVIDVTGYTGFSNT